MPREQGLRPLLRLLVLQQGEALPEAPQPAAARGDATKDADAENARDEVGVADEHWRKPLEARRAIEAKAARLKARARYRDGYKGELR